MSESNLNESHPAHMGPILAGLIIILVLIFIGMYLWGASLATVPTPEPLPEIINNEPETPRAIADQEIFETLSPSDELEAIEADLGSTNFDSLDTDITTIDAELSGDLQVQ